MDQDLVDALGGTPTANEKLYAAGLQDTRTSTAEWSKNNVTWAGDITNVQAYRKAVLDFTAWIKTQYAALPKDIFDNNDELYERCVMKGLELRKQTMTTSTSQASIDDIINDGFAMGGEIFRRLQSRKAQVLAKTLAPTAVPTTFP